MRPRASVRRFFMTFRILPREAEPSSSAPSLQAPRLWIWTSRSLTSPKAPATQRSSSRNHLALSGRASSNTFLAARNPAGPRPPAAPLAAPPGPLGQGVLEHFHGGPQPARRHAHVVEFLGVLADPGPRRGGAPRPQPPAR